MRPAGPDIPGGDETARGGSDDGVCRVVVDARGLACPAPVLRLAAAAHGAADGTVLTVLWTDPAAAYDVPAWVRMRGHALVDDGTPPDDRIGSGGGRAIIRVVRR